MQIKTVKITSNKVGASKSPKRKEIVKKNKMRNINIGSDYLNQQSPSNHSGQYAGMFASFSGKQVTAEMSKQHIRHGAESSQDIDPIHMKAIGSTLHTLINRKSENYQDKLKSRETQGTLPTEKG
jgi:hypothetical protein